MAPRHGGKMEQEYRTNQQQEPITRPSKQVITIKLNSKGKLNRIIFTNQFIEEEQTHITWGSLLKQEWDFEDANEGDLLRIFERFALKNPERFKELYFVLKNHDPKIFPIIKEALENTRAKFNFY